jgi:hypothetical protein
VDGGNEQRVAIKFCFKAGPSATETLASVQNTYENEALNLTKIFRRYSRFRDRRELLEDDERGGGPKLTRTEANIANVADFVKKKLPSNPTKNDSRIFEHPQVFSSYLYVSYQMEATNQLHAATALPQWKRPR